MTEALPSRKECLAILERAGCGRCVIVHSEAVEALAVKICRLANARVDLVRTGALLHDMGRARTHGTAHGVVGAGMARDMGLSEEITLIIERHIGAGIPEEEAKRAGLPVKDYMPETLEEKIVCHADSLIDESHRQPVQAACRRLRELGYEEAAERVLELHNELCRVCGTDIDLI